LVGDVLEAHSGSVEGSCLLGVANPEADVVEAVEDRHQWRAVKIVKVSLTEVGRWMMV